MDGKGTDHLRGAPTGQRRWRNGFMTEEKRDSFVLVVLCRTNISLEESRLLSRHLLL